MELLKNGLKLKAHYKKCHHFSYSSSDDNTSFHPFPLLWPFKKCERSEVLQTSNHIHLDWRCHSQWYMNGHYRLHLKSMNNTASWAQQGVFLLVCLHLSLKIVLSSFTLFITPSSCVWMSDAPQRFWDAMCKIIVNPITQ